MGDEIQQAGSAHPRDINRDCQVIKSPFATLFLASLVYSWSQGYLDMPPYSVSFSVQNIPDLSGKVIIITGFVMTGTTPVAVG